MAVAPAEAGRRKRAPICVSSTCQRAEVVGGIPPTKVMIIRHAEKPVPGQKSAIDKDGGEDPEALIVRGWQRAGALARFFVPRDGHFQAPGIAGPEKIIVPGFGAGSESKRPKQTVEPLAGDREDPIG